MTWECSYLYTRHLLDLFVSHDMITYHAVACKRVTTCKRSELYGFVASHNETLCNWRRLKDTTTWRRSNCNTQQLYGSGMLYNATTTAATWFFRYSQQQQHSFIIATMALPNDKMEMMASNLEPAKESKPLPNIVVSVAPGAIFTTFFTPIQAAGFINHQFTINGELCSSSQMFIRCNQCLESGSDCYLWIDLLRYSNNTPVSYNVPFNRLV